jgi:hypothetical protein
MFASKSIAEHLARGVVGIGAVVAAVLLAPTHPILALLAVPIALIALRGCPTCWTIGLLQTVAAYVAGKQTTRACTDGSCARRHTPT